MRSPLPRVCRSTRCPWKVKPFKLSASSISQVPFISSQRILACRRDTRLDGTGTSLLARRPTVRVSLLSCRCPTTLPSTSTKTRALSICRPFPMLLKHLHEFCLRNDHRGTSIVYVIAVLFFEQTRKHTILTL